MGRSRWQTIQRTVSASRFRICVPPPDEHAEDAVDRLAGVHRVKGAQDQVARLRGGKGDLHRLAVPHFADEDHLRRLAERRAQPAREGVEVVPHLPLVEGGLFVGMGELDRILERDDVDRLVPLISLRSAASDVDLPLPWRRSRG